MNKRITAVLTALLAAFCAAMPAAAAETTQPAETTQALGELPPETTETTAETTDTTALTENTENTETTEKTETTETTPAETTTTQPRDPESAMTFTELPDGTLCLSEYRWFHEMSVVIPSQHGGKPVTEIGEQAFLYCYADTVTLPLGIRKIGARAFEGCAYLDDLTIPETCTEIGERAFAGCKALGKISIPDTVTEIGRDAFENCMFLNLSGNTVIVLGGGVLYSAKGVGASFEIPENVRTVGAYALAGNEELTSVTIPVSTTRIMEHAFDGCSALRTVNCVPFLERLAPDAFDNTPFLEQAGDFVTVGQILLRYTGKNTIADLPANILAVGEQAFAGNAALTTFHGTTSLQEIRAGAFDGCTSLQIAELGDNLNSIGTGAFSGCQTLKYLRVGYRLRDIGMNAFRGCEYLTEVYLPDTLLTIGEYAFGYNTATPTRIKNALTLYSNTTIVRTYAQNNDIPHAALPLEENTDIPPEVTTAAYEVTENVPHGTSWIPACALGGVLVLAGFGAWVSKRRKLQA